VSDRPSSASSVQDALRHALEQIDAGHLPSQLLQRVRQAAEEKNSREFVLALTELFDNPDLIEKLDSSNFTEFAKLARRLELEEVGVQVLQTGNDLHKDDSTLRWELMRFMGTSPLRSIRSTARQSLEELLQVHTENGRVSVSTEELEGDSRHFGLLMDLLIRDEASEVALGIADAAQKAVPEDPIIMRNYGRALQAAGQGREAVEALEKATWLPGAVDVEPNYLASALANMNDQRGALEADLLACTRDPDDGSNFIRSAIALALAADEGALEQALQDSLYRPEIVSRLLVDALSCGLLSEADRSMASTLVRTFEIADQPIIVEPIVRELLDSPQKKGQIPLEARRADAERWYALAKTDRTAPPPKPDQSSAK
jgi:tetratricopeptide (TPR) repeat protein